MMRIRMGYPDAQAERGLLSGVDRREIVARLDPQMEGAELLALQQRSRQDGDALARELIEAVAIP